MADERPRRNVPPVKYEFEPRLTSGSPPLGGGSYPAVLDLHPPRYTTAADSDDEFEAAPPPRAGRARAGSGGAQPASRSLRRVVRDSDEEEEAVPDVPAGEAPADVSPVWAAGEDPHAALRGREPSRRLGGRDANGHWAPPKATPRPGRHAKRRRSSDGDGEPGSDGGFEDDPGDADAEEEEESEESEGTSDDSEEAAEESDEMEDEERPTTRRQAAGRRSDKRTSKRARGTVARFSPQRLGGGDAEAERPRRRAEGPSAVAAPSRRAPQRRFSLEDLVAGGADLLPPAPPARALEPTGGGERGGADIAPLAVDPSLGFDAVGGLQRYVAALKEMVFLPLLYPEVFTRFSLSPPRGVLLYGPPGTGKTLLARALAASCGRAGAKVTFFMRKGADILSKWVGESERQLRLLFEEAARQQPAIIFFDEIDGLAPARSAKSDQIHNSLVSTLLALMDGLDARGQVVVLGATNRIDALDAALRRPGRFDRELPFPLPNAAARREILGIHTRGWAPPPPPATLDALAESCVGFCGADLKALAAEAAVRALRRRFPQIYSSEAKLAIDAAAVTVGPADWRAAAAAVVPASRRGTAAPARPLPPGSALLLGAALGHSFAALGRLFPPAAAAGIAGAAAGAPGAAGSAGRWLPLGMRLGAPPSDDEGEEDTPMDGDGEEAAVAAILAAAQPLARRPRLLLCGPRGAGHAPLAAALLHALEAFPVHSIALPSLLADAHGRTPEEALCAAFAEARRAAPAVLFLPHLGAWWAAAGQLLRAALLMLLDDVPPDLPLLLLATAELPAEADESDETMPLLGSLFAEDQTLIVPPPDAAARLSFWRAALGASVAGAGRAAGRAAAARRLARAAQPPTSLPLAPPSAAEQAAAAAAAQAAAAAAGADARAFRAHLRAALASMLPDRRYKEFWGQPSEEAFPGWRAAQAGAPCVDLTRMLRRCDDGSYGTPGAFVRDAVALPEQLRRYFDSQPPERESASDDELLLSRACALRDHLEGIAAAVDPALARRLEAALPKPAAPASAAAEAVARATRQAAPLPADQPWRIGAKAMADPEAEGKAVRAQKRAEEARARAEAEAAAVAVAAAHEAAETEAAAAREAAAKTAAEMEAAAAAAVEAAAAAAAAEAAAGSETDEETVTTAPAQMARLAQRLSDVTEGHIAEALEAAAARLGDAVRALPPRPGRRRALAAAAAFCAALEARR